MSHQNVALIPGICEVYIHSKRDFADMISGNRFGDGGIILDYRWVQYNYMNFLKAENISQLKSERSGSVRRLHTLLLAQG